MFIYQSSSNGDLTCWPIKCLSFDINSSTNCCIYWWLQGRPFIVFQRHMAFLKHFNSVKRTRFGKIGCMFKYINSQLSTPLKWQNWVKWQLNGVLNVKIWNLLIETYSGAFYLQLWQMYEYGCWIEESSRLLWWKLVSRGKKKISTSLKGIYVHFNHPQG